MNAVKAGIWTAGKSPKGAAMQEDIAGTRNAWNGNSYGICAECGQAFILPQQPHFNTRWREADGTDDDLSELCPQCEELDLEEREPLRVGPAPGEREEFILR